MHISDFHAYVKPDKYLRLFAAAQTKLYSSLCRVDPALVINKIVCLNVSLLFSVSYFEVILDQNINLLSKRWQKGKINEKWIHMRNMGIQDVWNLTDGLVFPQ